jgi:hypothetical protein
VPQQHHDQLEGPARWQAIRTIIDSLIDLTDAQQTELLKNTQSNALYNRQHLAELTAR